MCFYWNKLGYKQINSSSAIENFIAFVVTPSENYGIFCHFGGLRQRLLRYKISQSGGNWICQISREQEFLMIKSMMLRKCMFSKK